MRNKILVIISIVFITALVLFGLLLFTKTPVKIPKGGVETPVFQTEQTKFTDKEILDAVYSNYKTPDGFFVDTLEKGEKISDSVYYVRMLENNNWIFYCTNDINTAKQLVDRDIAEYHKTDDSSGRMIVDASENEKFFEFKTLETHKTLPGMKYYLRYRAYKCSYLSDLQYGMYYKKDKSISDGYIGTFTKKPITTENVKELVEFLWYSAFSNYNLGGAKVLSSFTGENGDSIKHTLFETSTTYGDWGLYDQITLIKSIYTVNKNSGEIRLIKEDIKTLQGRGN